MDSEAEFTERTLEDGPTINGMQGVTLQSALHQRNQQTEVPVLIQEGTGNQEELPMVSDTLVSKRGPRDFEIKRHKMVNDNTYDHDRVESRVNGNTYIKVVKRRAKRDKFADANEYEIKTSKEMKAKCSQLK